MNANTIRLQHKILLNIARNKAARYKGFVMSVYICNNNYIRNVKSNN